jgi:mono/diheme cytochrome c family protein
MWNAMGSRQEGSAGQRMLATGMLIGALVLAPPAQAESRGELLYATHCIGCHTAQVHWREQKLVTDWSSLKAQVRRWQGANSLGWGEADVLDVTRYLNDSFYRFAQTSDPLSSLGGTSTDRGQFPEIASKAR